MTDRLPTHLLVGALLRRTNDGGGFGAVLVRGDASGGGVLVLVVERGGPTRILERGLGADGGVTLINTTPRDDPDGYWRRRRSRDPDLWVVELDTPDAERFAAETLL